MYQVSLKRHQLLAKNINEKDKKREQKKSRGEYEK